MKMAREKSLDTPYAVGVPLVVAYRGMRKHTSDGGPCLCLPGLGTGRGTQDVVCLKLPVGLSHEGDRKPGGHAKRRNCGSPVAWP